MTEAILPVDPGLLARFRGAGERIVWRAAEAVRAPGPRRRARIARLSDEEARVESWGRPPAGGLEVDAGPVGALVLLLEADRRGALPALESRNAGVDTAFSQGAVRAVWGPRPESTPGPTIRDLVELARYALA